jgi:hypothetical protein
MIELNHMIAGSIISPLSGTVNTSDVVSVLTPSPVFDLKMGGLFKIDSTIDRSQVKDLGEKWNNS